MVLQNPNAKKKAPVKKGEYVVKTHDKSPTPLDNEVDPNDSTKYTIDTRILDLIENIKSCPHMQSSEYINYVQTYLEEYLIKIRYYRYRLIDAAYDPDYVSAMHPNTHHDIESKLLQQLVNQCWQNPEYYKRVKTAMATIEVPEESNEVD
jgi:hypothetical protein